MSNLKDTIKDHLLDMTTNYKALPNLRSIKEHAKQIYIELLKLEYPCNTDIHKESLSEQAYLLALIFEKTIEQKKFKH